MREFMHNEYYNKRKPHIQWRGKLFWNIWNLHARNDRRNPGAGLLPGNQFRNYISRLRNKNHYCKSGKPHEAEGERENRMKIAHKGIVCEEWGRNKIKQQAQCNNRNCKQCSALLAFAFLPEPEINCNCAKSHYQSNVCKHFPNTPKPCKPFNQRSAPFCFYYRGNVIGLRIFESFNKESECDKRNKDRASPKPEAHAELE